MARQGWPLCIPEEQAAVHCFDDWWKVDVGFSMVERSGKMFCPVQVIVSTFLLIHFIIPSLTYDRLQVYGSNKNHP